MMLRVLFLMMLCTGLSQAASAGDLPTPEHGTVLRIQGSNTIGAALGPALVEGLLSEQGLRKIHRETPNAANELRIVGETVQGRRIVVEVAAHGSSTGFTALKTASADLAASSRPIKDSELASLQSLGDLKSPSAEQVIAIDGLAIILHPDNPLNQLDTVQLARIFSGEVKSWEDIGGRGGPIHLYARDDQSGTYDTFKELVLSGRGKTLGSAAKRFESSEQLSDAVSADPQGIGFIGLPYVRQAKAVAIIDGQSQAMPPLNSLIATEDYPLSRRLFFYLPPTEKIPGPSAGGLCPKQQRASDCRRQRLYCPDRPGHGRYPQCVDARGIPVPQSSCPTVVGEFSLRRRQCQPGQQSAARPDASARLYKAARQNVRASDTGGFWRCQERPDARRSALEAAGHGGTTGVGEERRGVSRNSRIRCRNAGGGQ